MVVLVVLGLVVLAVVAVAVYDLVQPQHAVLRNFPVVGHLRYILESFGPETRQYLVTDNDSERPFSRDQRRWIYTSAKLQDNTFGFGTDNDIEHAQDYLVIKHAAFPLSLGPARPSADLSVPAAKVLGGASGRRLAFRPASIVNVSGMSFGSLSAAAIESINEGAAIVGCWQNTGEGGISPYHLRGADLVWQVGTGYFGCRDGDGRFSLDRLADVVAEHPQVRAIEIKLSQGAKPGIGGMLPGVKVTPEIAAIRGIAVGVDCKSPAHHTAFGDVDSLLELVETIADRTGLPVGIKSAVGEQAFWTELAARTEATGRALDFITVDGGEGGTGAGPLVFTDHVALPFRTAFARVYRTFAERPTTTSRRTPTPDLEHGSGTQPGRCYGRLPTGNHLSSPPLVGSACGRRHDQGMAMAEFSLELNDDQQQLKDWIHTFAVDVMRPAAEEWDEREEFPWPVVEEAAKIGLYGFDFIANAMLGDPTGLTLPVAIEEMFWGDAGIGLSIMGSGLAAAGISGNGTPEQTMEWVPQCYGTADDVKLGAFCVSEPDAGSDVSSLRTRAVYDEAKDEWTLNGTKAWITNGGIADIHVVVAAVDPDLKGRGQASFVIPPNTPGLSQGQKYKKHGIRASHTAEVVLDDVRIPGACLLGGKDKLDEKLARAREAAGKPAQGTSGKQPAMATFEATRPAVGAQALGVARAAYEYSLEYAKEREAFGRPIIMNQSIAFMLANMCMEIDAARLLVWRAAWLSRNGKYVNAEGSQSKLYAGRTAVWVTERAIQILGGYGYTREYPVERWHRDAKIFDIFEGTEQIQELVISRAISGLRIE